MKVFSILIYIVFFSLSAFAQTPLNSAINSNSAAGTKSDRILLNAKSFKRLTKENTIHLQDNVQIVFGDNSLTCDEAFIRQNTDEIEALGHVYFVSPSAVVSGDRIIINYKTKVGTIYNGVIQMGQVIFEGEIIYKKGETEYEAISADYSACTTCPPAWSFSGSHIKAQTGGYAHISNSVLRIVKVPVFWLPYLIVPLNTKRQSGFLFPGFGYSQTAGLNYSQAFFWAINESEDATITAKYIQRRGLKGLLNYRYVLTEESRGEADFGYIKDKLLQNDEVMKETGYEGKRINRWHMKYKHSYVLPYDFTHKLDLKLISDLRYARDFNKEFSGWGDPSLENRMSLTKNTESAHMSADTSIYINQLKYNPITDNRDSVHRFPEIKYSISPTKIFHSPFMFNLDSRYVNFTRDSYTFDDRKINSDGSFSPEDDPTKIGVYNSERDLIRTGQRLDLIPRVSAPIEIGPYIDLMPAISYRETIYQFSLGEKKAAQRRLIRTDVSARTRFSRIFDEDENSSRSVRYRHEIVPEITHTSIPWVQRQLHPFFGPSDQESFYTANTALNDSDHLQFDYHDRLYERNLLTFSITNYLTRKKWSGDTATYNQIALFKISQSYDYFESIKKSNPRQPWSDISALLDVRLDYFETNSLVRYYPYQNVATTSSRIKGIHPKGHFIEFNYSQDFVITKGSQVKTDSRTEDLITSAGINLPYLTIVGQNAYSFVTHKIKTWGYTLQIKPPGNCWYIEFGQAKTDTDLDYSFNFSFLFDGKTATSLSPNKAL